MPTTPSHGYAGFWKRFVAYIIDAILLWIVFAILGMVLGSDPMQGSGLMSLLSIAIAWVYFAYMESSDKQATLGKVILGLKVTDLQGKRISFLHATGRHFAKFVSALILCIGFIMVAFTDKKQGLHDMIAGTLVVNK